MRMQSFGVLSLVALAFALFYNAHALDEIMATTQRPNASNLAKFPKN